MIGSANPSYQSKSKEIHLQGVSQDMLPSMIFWALVVTAKMTICIRKWLIFCIRGEWHCNFIILWVIINFLYIKLFLHCNRKHLEVFVLLVLHVKKDFRYTRCYWVDKIDHFIVNNSPPFDRCNQMLQLNRTKPSTISECCVLFHFFDTIEQSFGSSSIIVTPFFFFFSGGSIILCLLSSKYKWKVYIPLYFVRLSPSWEKSPILLLAPLWTATFHSILFLTGKIFQGIIFCGKYVHKKLKKRNMSASPYINALTLTHEEAFEILPFTLGPLK